MLRICLLMFLLCYAAAFGLVFYFVPLPLPLMYVAAGVCSLGLAALFYFLLRLFRFRVRLSCFLHQALSGRYKPGISVPGRTSDEFIALERLVNKFAVQLQDYDSLRASRVALFYRVIDYVTRNIPQAVIVADVERRAFSFNPSAQELFEFEQESLSFDSILAQNSNAAFKKIFEKAVEKERVPQEGEVTMEIPIRETRKDVFVHIMPFKDKEETVKLAVIFVDLSRR